VDTVYFIGLGYSCILPALCCSCKQLLLLQPNAFISCSALITLSYWLQRLRRSVEVTSTSGDDLKLPVFRLCSASLTSAFVRRCDSEEIWRGRGSDDKGIIAYFLNSDKAGSCIDWGGV